MLSVVVADEDDPGQFSVLYKNGHLLARTRDLAEIAWRSDLSSSRTHSATGTAAIYIDATPIVYDGATALLPDADVADLLQLSRHLSRAGVSLRLGGRIAIDPESAQPVPIPPRLAVPARRSRPDSRRRRLGSTSSSSAWTKGGTTCSCRCRRGYSRCSASPRRS